MKIYPTTYSGLIDILPEIDSKHLKRALKLEQFYDTETRLKEKYEQLKKDKYANALIYRLLTISFKGYDSHYILEPFERTVRIFEESELVSKNQAIKKGYLIRNQYLEKLHNRENVVLEYLEKRIREDEKFGEDDNVESFNSYLEKWDNPFFIDKYLIKNGDHIEHIKYFRLYNAAKSIFAAAKESLYFNSDLIISIDSMISPTIVRKEYIDKIVSKNDMNYIPKLKEWYSFNTKFSALQSMDFYEMDIDWSTFDSELNKSDRVGGPIFKKEKFNAHSPANLYFGYFFTEVLHFIRYAKINASFKKKSFFVYPLLEFKERINYLNDSGLFDKFLETFKARYLQDYSVPRLKCDPSEVDKVHEKFVNLFTEIAKHDLKSQGWGRLGEAVVFYHNEEE